MNKTIYEAEFTKMVHDKMREANRFKEYERIPKNRIGGDYWNTYWTIRYMLRTMTDILENGDKVILAGGHDFVEGVSESKMIGGYAVI